MSRIVFHTEQSALPPLPVAGETHVWLYGSSAPASHIGVVGSQALDTAYRLGVPPSRAAIDFLSIAMAVTAADTFVLRDDTFNRWSFGQFEIVLPLADRIAGRACSTSLIHAPVSQRRHLALHFCNGGNVASTGGSGSPPPTCCRSFQSRLCRTILRRPRQRDRRFGPHCRRLPTASGKSRLAGDADHQKRVAALNPVACQRMPVNTYPTLKNFRRGQHSDSKLSVFGPGGSWVPDAHELPRKTTGVPLRLRKRVDRPEPPAYAAADRFSKHTHGPSALSVRCPKNLGYCRYPRGHRKSIQIYDERRNGVRPRWRRLFSQPRRRNGFLWEVETAQSAMRSLRAMLDPEVVAACSQRCRSYLLRI